MTDEKSNHIATKNGAASLAKGGVFAGFLAFIGASCCVLPILLINIGVSTSVVAKLGFFAKYQAWFQWAAILLLVSAVIIAFRHGRPRPPMFIWLAVGTILAVAAFILPYNERELLHWINR